MDGVFGAGNRTNGTFETANTASLFSASTDFIFLEGGDDNANELEAFLTTNLPPIESWVFNGGHIFINSAPNEGGGMSFGFGGVSLNYQDFSSSVTGVDASHPIFNGPYGATGTAFTSSSFAHASVSGPGLNGLIIDAIGGASVLSETFWETGYAMFGGMTTLNFQRPNSFALRQNILYYALIAEAEAEAAQAPAATPLALIGIGLAIFAGYTHKKKLA